MFDKKIILTVVVIAVAAGLLYFINTSKALSNEGFWGGVPPRIATVVKEVINPAKNCSGYSLQNNFQTLGSDRFFSRPNFQATLSPRMSNVDYGANIKYNMPSYQNQGVPCDPMSLADMVKENYKEGYNCSGKCGEGCSSCNSVTRCGKGGVPLTLSTSGAPNISQNPNFVSAMNNVYESSGIQNAPTDLVSVGDMSVLSPDGTVENVQVFDRYVYANLKNTRLRAQADKIRGDLPIAPDNCHNKWFQVSVNPIRDLEAGAMNVIAGPDNATNKALTELMYQASGQSHPTLGGVDLTNEFKTTLGASAGDIVVSSFA